MLVVAGVVQNLWIYLKPLDICRGAGWQ